MKKPDMIRRAIDKARAFFAPSPRLLETYPGGIIIGAHLAAPLQFAPGSGPALVTGCMIDSPRSLG